MKFALFSILSVALVASASALDKEEELFPVRKSSSTTGFGRFHMPKEHSLTCWCDMVLHSLDGTPCGDSDGAAGKIF